ncbi:hypothetical protein JDV02_002217 [Purpureocillium takamizusanense]|uniref:Uncharacterized protein n=1 Tax=Purpureocillium takamizusanense TaxID=2060973 RepID=A0A9Q8V8L2_9HYPO|nr:uncharacterized protein JDV02_002217 [Purpureocillium takamizusanense]UNI15711.1 hypothetical protein JDV02_002217 [Purpureocillium takamizusanense]
MSGIPSVIIRFICHIPLGFLASNGFGMYNRMKGLGSIYDAVPGGQSFLQGARVIGGVGWPLFAYNFVCFALTGFLDGLALATIGLIDLVFTIVLVAGTAMEANFLPRTYGACKHASDWRDGPDGRNFFDEAVRGGRWVGFPRAEDLCHGMVQHWAFCIAVTIIYGISGCMNLAIGLREVHGAGRRFSSTWVARSIPPDFWVLRPLALTMRHCLPSLRFLHRYAGKLLARWRPVRTQPYEYRQLLGLRAGGDAGSAPGLPFKVTSFLAEELHFVELLSLVASTEQMAAMLLGTKDPARELEELRSFTCAGTDKSQCRICDAQVCSVCAPPFPPVFSSFLLWPVFI